MTSITISRRRVLLSLTTAAVALLPKASSAGELATLKIGTIEVSTISDGHLQVPHAWFPNASDAALASTGEAVGLGMNVWLVKTGGYRYHHEPYAHGPHRWFDRAGCGWIQQCENPHVRSGMNLLDRS